MRDRGFDQLPVSTASGSRLVGLVTLGNLLSYISSGRATGASPVKDVMFDFERLDGTVSDPDAALKSNLPVRQRKPASADSGTQEEQKGASKAEEQTNGSPPEDTAEKDEKPSSGKKSQPRRPFVEITLDTPLSALSRFFERNSAAVVTERQESGSLRAVAVVTKVDLLNWLVRKDKERNGD